MPTVLDLFSGSEFSSRALTESINEVPNRTDRLGEGGLGLFPHKGVPTTYIRLAYTGAGDIHVLPRVERGGPATKGMPKGARFINFDIPHFPHEDFVSAMDIQNRLAGLGQDQQFETAQALINDKLETMTAKHYRTQAFHRLGALKGLLIDADGSVIYNLFTEFGIMQKVVNFELDDDTTDVAGKTIEVKRHQEDNLNGDIMTGTIALCSREFFDKYVGHPDVEKAYDRYQSSQEPLRDDVRAGFRHKGVLFKEFYETFSVVDPITGTVTEITAVDEGEALFFPEGTTATQTYLAPPNFLEEANQAPPAGKLMYAKQAPDKWNSQIEIHTQSNFLPMIKRPALIVKGVAE